MKDIGAHLLLGPLVLLIAVVFKVFPPKDINSFYGFRTPTSMKSQEVWEEANRYSGNVLFVIAAVMICLQLGLYFTNVQHSVLFAAIFLVVSIIATIFITQLHLKKNFDQAGKRIPSASAKV